MSQGRRQIGQAGVSDTRRAHRGIGPELPREILEPDAPHSGRDVRPHFRQSHHEAGISSRRVSAEQERHRHVQRGEHDRKMHGDEVPAGRAERDRSKVRQNDDHHRRQGAETQRDIDGQDGGGRDRRLAPDRGKITIDQMRHLVPQDRIAQRIPRGEPAGEAGRDLDNLERSRVVCVRHDREAVAADDVRDAPARSDLQRTPRRGDPVGQSLLQHRRQAHALLRRSVRHAHAPSFAVRAECQHEQWRPECDDGDHRR